MYPTDTYQARADALFEKWENHPQFLRDAIAEALAQAREEGRVEGQVEGRNETRLAAEQAENQMYALEEFRKKNYDAFLERGRAETELKSCDRQILEINRQIILIEQSGKGKVLHLYASKAALASRIETIRQKHDL